MRPAAAVVASLLGQLALMGPGVASAQSLGTFRWQLAPFCNTVTVTVTQGSGVYTLDGFDNQCGAPQRAPVVGVATPNPDGTIGLGFQIVTVPGGRLVGVDARISLNSLGGPWTDSAGNSGTMVFNGPGSGSARPLPSAGPVWGTVISSPVSPTSPVGLGIVIGEPTPSVGAAVAAQWGEAPTAMPSSPAAVVGASRDQFGVLGSSTTSSGVAGTSSTGMGISGESASGAGVFGMSSSGPGVIAVNSGSGSGVALEVSNGAVRVSGGVTPAFEVTTTPANTAGHITTLDHPLLNSTPSAVVFVTRVWGGGTSTANITGLLSVFYNGTSWAIFREDGLGMPLNTRFNVLVVSR